MGQNLKNTKKCTTWLKQLPAVGFNSGNYDLNLEKHLIPILSKNKPDLSIIKKGNCFLSMSIPEIVFTDLKNYLAPNYSLLLFYKHYGATEAKGSFPYGKKLKVLMI